MNDVVHQIIRKRMDLLPTSLDNFLGRHQGTPFFIKTHTFILFIRKCKLLKVKILSKFHPTLHTSKGKSKCVPTRKLFISSREESIHLLPEIYSFIRLPFAKKVLSEHLLNSHRVFLDCKVLIRTKKSLILILFEEPQGSRVCWKLTTPSKETKLAH